MIKAYENYLLQQYLFSSRRWPLKVEKFKGKAILVADRGGQ
jgi:hypothetical protein